MALVSEFGNKHKESNFWKEGKLKNKKNKKTHTAFKK